MKDDDTIHIVHNLARSGGTLIGRCLGCMDGVRLLSEIHPLGHRNKHFNALHQYQSWHHDLGIVDWKSIGFDESIDTIYRDCAKSGNRLVLRDWAHIDFIGPPALRDPNFEFLLDQRLVNRYRLIHAAIVRHPLEMWRSMRKAKIFIENNISVTQHLSAYRRYLEQIADFPVIRYEDFTLSPENEMKRLCEALELPYDPDFIDRWPNNNSITGDVYNHSRAGDSNEICQLEVKPIDQEFQWLLEGDSDYNWIVDTLKYEF